MSVKLRLRRQGRKGIAYYHVVVADSRSPRDGKFIEQIGVYDPTRNPAVVEVDHDKAISWLKKGAEMTDTVRAIMKYSGVNLKYALMKQGKDEATINRIFNAWWDERQAKVSSKVSGLAESKRKSASERLKQEAAIREQRAARIIEKRTPKQEAPAAPEAEASAEAPAEENA